MKLRSLGFLKSSKLLIFNKSVNKRENQSVSSQNNKLRRDTRTIILNDFIANYREDMSKINKIQQLNTLKKK